METNSNFQTQFYELCEHIGNSESSLLQSLGNYTAIDENPYRKLYYFKAPNALFSVINGKVESIVCPVSSVDGAPLEVKDQEISLEGRNLGMTWKQEMEKFGSPNRINNWDSLIKNYRTNNGLEIQLIVSYDDINEFAEKIELDRHITNFRASLSKEKAETIINPMYLSNFDFARYRYMGDDGIGTSTFTILHFLSFEYIYPKLQTILKNNDPVNFNDLVLGETILKKTAEQGPEFISITNKLSADFLTTFFEDKTTDQSGNSRDQLFYFTDSEKEVLHNAAKLFCSHMTEATLALAVRSLLKQYAAYNSTNVLVFTRLLPKYPHRRILATMQFVMDVMDINAFEPEGKGIRAIQKLRLTHDMIRFRIFVANQEQTNKWNYNDWGSPINQQDMLFAIHTFSVEVIKGLLSSGVKLTKEEIENYYLAWHLIGRALGVNQNFNPTDYTIGEAVQNRIYAKEFTENNPNAKVLGDPLIQFLDDMLPLATRGGVLSLVKLFNDPGDYNSIFNNILKIDLSKSQSYYIVLYKFGIGLLHLFVDIKYFFLKDKTNYVKDTARMQHKLFSFIINKVKTWSDNNFRIADGFGEQFAIEDKKKSESR